MTTAVAPDPAASRRSFAMGLMVVSSVAISFGGLIIRSMDEASAWQINFYRALALVVCVSLILAIRYRGAAVARVRGIGRPGLLGGALLAGAGMAFLQAITNTTVANTLFMMSAIPFFTAALAWVFLREPLRRSTLATMAVAAAGILVMTLDGVSAGSFFGNAMALVTVICFSGFAVVVRRHRTVDMFPTLLVSGCLLMPVSAMATLGDLRIPLHDLLLCFLLGGILSGFANLLFITASRHLEAAELTLFMLLEFALGPIWVWLVIREVPTLWTIAGGLLVIAAVLVRVVFDLRRARPKLRRGRPSPM